MDVEFVIPLKKEDLLKEREDQYYVKGLTELSECIETLDDIKLKVNGDPQNACESVPSFFDIIFSMLHDSKEISCLQLNDIFDGVIYRLLQHIVNYVEDVLNREPTDIQVNKETVNLSKMIFYLFSMFQRTYEEKASLKTDNLIVEPKRMRGGKSKSKKQDGHISWDWNAKKKLTLAVINSFLQLDIAQLWCPPVAEESFINLIANCCYKMFEGQEIIQAKNKPLRDSIAQVLSLLVKKHNHIMTLVPSFVQIVKHHESSAGALSGCLVTMVRECDCDAGVVSRVIRELCDTVQEDHLTASLPKTAASLITELTEADITLLAPSIATLVRYLLLEAYPMRIAILVAVVEIICLLSEEKEPSSKDLKTKEYLFKALQKHIFDQNTYVRSKVCQLWIKLVTERKVPEDKIVSVLKSMKYLITDKSCHVSKNAIHFFSVALQYNPFANRFIMSELRSMLEKKKAALSMVNPEQILSREEFWESYEAQIIECLSKLVEDDDTSGEMEVELDTNNLTVDNLIEIMYKLINEKCFADAFAWLKQAEKLFPDSPEVRCNIDKDTHKLNYYITIFKKAYFAAPISLAVNADDVNVQTQLYQKLKETVAFAECINEAGKDIYRMLMSKGSSEVVEAVGFFTTAFQFGLADSKKAFRDMLVLMKSDQPTVKEAVAEAYRSIYLTMPDASGSLNLMQVVHRIIKLLQSVTMEQKYCFEELIQMWTKNEEISKDFIMKLWDKFFKKIPGTSDDDSAAAAIILDMIAKLNIQLVIDNLSVVVEGLDDPENFLKIEYICAMLTKLSTRKVNQKYIRYSSDNKLFSLIRSILFKNFANVEIHLYNNMATAVINMIFKICLYPEKLAFGLIAQLFQHMVTISSEKKEDLNSNDLQLNEQLLARFIWIYGHVVFRMWQYFDCDVFNNLKKCKDGVAPEKNPDVEDEFDADNEVAADDALYEIIGQMCDKQFLSESPFNNYIVGLVVDICSHSDGYVSSYLKSMAALTLAKFMMVSQTFCENNIQLYVTQMGKSKDEIIRANLVLGFADLTARFPNIIEPWTIHLYGRLKDLSKLVRTNTVTVLSHLISREMVKVRGQIAELTLCLEDPEPQIADRVKHLMSDIAQKGNTLYNVIPDIISRLSNPERAERIAVDSFNNIIRYILSLVTKERQNELLVEKLCVRLNETSDERQCRDLAFCLGELSYNDKSLRKLIECFPLLKDHLNMPQVYSAIAGIFVSCQKSLKPGVKEIAMEGNDRLERLISGEGDGGDDYEARLTSDLVTPMKCSGRDQITKNTRGGRSTVKRNTKTPGKTPARRPKKIIYDSDSDSSEETFKETRSRRTKQAIVEESDSD